MLTTQPSDLSSFTFVLTSKIQADLSTWYGPTAQLIGAPTFHPRAWSYFFRYRVRVSEALTKAILVKIRHTEAMSITEAMLHEKMKTEMQDEYASLANIETTFASIEDSSHFFTIRPLTLYKDLNVLVMEEANIRPIKSYFQAPAMWWNGKARQDFETYIERAGHWLRIFHNHIGEIQANGPFLSDTWYHLTKERLARLNSSQTSTALTATLSFVEEQFEEKKGVRTPYRTLHEDFNAANVFVTPDGKICSFDPHNRPGPIYYDLAKILTDLELSRTQMLTFGLSVPPSWFKKYQDAFLKGYFNHEPFNKSALTLFRLLTLIERWDEAELNYFQATGRKKIFYIFSMPQMRLFLSGLLRKQLAEGQQVMPG